MEKKAILKDKKMLIKLGGIFMAGIVLILCSGIPMNDKPAEILPQAADVSAEDTLQEVLSQIKGVGQVSIYIHYGSLSRREYAVNENMSENSRRESDGGKTVINNESSSTVNYFTAGSDDEPLLLQEFAPEIEAVLIVAEGAGSGIVREQLFSSVQSLLGLPANRISIAEMK